MPYKNLHSPEAIKSRDKGAKKYWKAHASEISAKRRNLQLLAKYGITADEFNQLRKSQDGKCKLCGEVLDEIGVVDHCHKGSIIRGILHNKCNLLLGHSGDSEEKLTKAIEYLRSDFSRARAIPEATSNGTV